MRELKVRGVQRDAFNTPFCGFFGAILPVANHRVAGRCKLRAYLILQTGNQRYTHQRCSAQDLLHGIVQFSPRCSRVILIAQFLVHSLATEVMHQSARLIFQMPTNNAQIYPHRRMLQKLPHQPIAITLRLSKQQYPRREPINAMYGVGALFFPPQLRG